MGGALLRACEQLLGRGWIEAGGDAESLDADVVRAAYRRRAFEVHPDRAAALGRPAEALSAELRALGDAHATLLRHLARRDVASPSTEAPLASPASPTSPAAEAPGATRLHRGVVPARSLRFGEFLYYSCWISRGELRDALAWQRETRPRFGEVALALRVLRRRDVEALLADASPRVPMGERAVGRGILGAAERDRVLGIQRRMQSPLGAYFVERGLLSTAEVRRLAERQTLHNRRRATTP